MSTTAMLEFVLDVCSSTWMANIQMHRDACHGQFFEESYYMHFTIGDE